jgi:hypothetical protein
LNAIFKLSAIKRTPTDEVNKVDQLILDYHYINYTFCQEKSYSNEKVSTFLAIMNFILHTMIKNQLPVEEGIKMLKGILAKHCEQRPPFSIFIFTRQEATEICNFALNSFFRHYSLYEYSFKPKIELVLQTIPVGGWPQSTLNETESQKEASNVN